MELFGTTGPQRRAWLDSADAKLAELMRYYLGPSGVDERVNALATVAPYAMDGMDYIDAQTAGQEFFADPSLANALAFTTPMVALAVPGISNRLAEGLADVGADAARFVADESGALRLYHGSPHDFDKFSMDKIGTGEGAQAYGHGLYFAENENTAKAYRDALSPTLNAKVWEGVNQDGMRWSHVNQIAQQISDIVDSEGIDALSDYAAPRGFEDAWNRGVRAARDNYNSTGGHLYEVNVNANPDDFLDWDRPLSEQPQKVRDALGPRIDVLRQAGAGISQDPMGDALWRASHPQGGLDKTDFSRSVPEQAMERLREAGIPGIRYLDAGSRGAGDGSRNYVVFDENLITIVRKYGIAGAAAMLGVSQADIAQAMGVDAEGAPLMRPFNAADHKPRQNADGSQSTELEITMESPDGAVWNIPTLWFRPDGTPIELPPEVAANLAQRYEAASGKYFPRFRSIDEAVSFAVARSAKGGAGVSPLAGGYGILGIDAATGQPMASPPPRAE